MANMEDGDLFGRGAVENEVRIAPERNDADTRLIGDMSQEGKLGEARNELLNPSDDAASRR
jgi:hypothetical protein